MQIIGTTFPEFTYVVDKTKAYEFAKAIGDELRQVDGEFLAPIGMIFFVIVQDNERIFSAFNITWNKAVFGGVKLKYHRPIKVGETLRGKTECIANTEKGEGDKKFGIFELETRYLDEAGHEVLYEISTVIVKGITDENEKAR